MKRKKRNFGKASVLLIAIMLIASFSGLALADPATLTSVTLSVSGQSQTVNFSGPGDSQTIQLDQSWGSGNITVTPFAPAY